MIRPVREDELDWLCGAITSIDPWLKLEITAESLSRGIQMDGKRTVLVYEEEGHVLGAVITRTDAAEMLYYFNWGEQLAAHDGMEWPCEWTVIPAAGYVGSLAVFPGSQGKGIGGILLAEAEQRARALGLERMYLMVTDRNNRAKEFYQRKGYVAIAFQDDCIQPGNREWLMEKMLGENLG